MRIYEKIILQMKQMIHKGELVPGDRLPSERDLAKQLNCSRTSLKEACRVLESEGVIVSKQGGGRYIQSIKDDLTISSLYSPVDLLEKSAIFQFIEAREILESEIASIAALRATDADIKKLTKILSSMRQEFSSNYEAVTADANFHVALAEATNNFVFVSMIKLNLNMYRQVRKQTLQLPYRKQAAYEEHVKIFEAIQQRNPEDAKNAMLNHLQKLKENVLNGGRESENG